MSSYTKYHRAYYYKKMWMKERAKMVANAEKNVGEYAGLFIYMNFIDFNSWLKYKGIDL